MATLASSFLLPSLLTPYAPVLAPTVYAAKRLVDASSKQAAVPKPEPTQTPYGPNTSSATLQPISTPSAPAVPATAQISALRGTSAPAPTQPKAPAPAPQPTYDFSQDAFTPQANVSGMTPQQMGQQAQLNSDVAAMLRQTQTGSDQQRERAMDVARMNNISYDDAVRRMTMAQAAQSGALSVPSGMYFNPATAVQQGFTTYNTAPQNYLASQIPKLPTNSELMEQYRRNDNFAADLGDGRFGFSNAGLKPPSPDQFATQDEYNTAVEQYNTMKLEEASLRENSPQVMQARIREAEEMARKEVESMQLQAAEERARVREQNNASRERLLQSLALRGLTPDTDESARRQLLEFDQNAARAEEAAAALGRVSVAQAMGKASAGAVERQQKLVADIAAQMEKAIAALATKQKTDIAGRKMTLEEQKAEVDRAYKEGRITLQERDLARKELDSEAARELKGAQTERIETLLPGEADRLSAQTGKLTAETERIKTLTPLEAQKITASINKSQQLRNLAGGNVAGTDLSAAYQFLAAQGVSGTPSRTQEATAVRYLRETGQLETPVQAGEAIAELKGKAKAIITPPKAENKGINFDDPLIKSAFGL